METIQIDTKSEQAQALINYLKTLPFVKFKEDESLIITSEHIEIKPEPEIPEDNSGKEEIYKEEIKSEVIELVISTNTDEPEVKPEENSLLNNSLNHGIFSDVLEKQLFTDLRKALSLNDKFRFQRDLFNGNMTEMNESLEQLNAFSSFPEAWDHINNKYQWNPENDSVAAFKQLLEKRFS